MGLQPFRKAVSAIFVAALLLVCLAPSSHADRKTAARDQFERAVRMRTMLEGYLEKDRSLAEYKQTIAAFHKVYLITTQAEEVTQSLIAEAELYGEMGKLFDQKYYGSSIESYNFLIKQYPGSRYRGQALLAIAQIQKDDLHDVKSAQASYKDYLEQFPHSEKAPDARAALKGIVEGKTKESAPAPAETAASTTPQNPAAADTMPRNPSASDSRVKEASAKDVRPGEISQLPDLQGKRVEPRVSDKGASVVKNIQTWNSERATRVIVTLDDTVEYSAARIASPDRIYFDLQKARLTPGLMHESPEVENGLLKSVRVAPNKPGVVRVVLDVNGARDYSAYLLANPYRLVIEVRSAKASSPTPSPAAASPGSATEVSDAHPVPPAPPAERETVTIAQDENQNSSPPSVAVAKKSAKPGASSLPVRKEVASTIALDPPAEAKPTHDGDRSLTRALGLKINRIVIDPGHGGHDTGTIGPHGLMEKDLCLDVALRLGALIQQKLPGADVIYTRKDDTFVPLEERTAIANAAKADLFISIHANSSQDPSARGIETYYLNFSTSPESMEVATRENANSQESLHDLQDLIQKIARNEKIEESKELAGDIQGTLTQRLQLISRNEKDRGVKKAPFVVLIGANMPSVLSEISFVSNPSDERLLRRPEQRERIADGLYRGISTYLSSLNSLNYNKQKLVSDNHNPEDHLEPATVVPAGNPK